MELIVIGVMIAVNSVFAAYEIALASIAVGRLHVLVHERQHGAAAALRMKQKIEASLAVVQLGITLVGAIAAATGGAGAEQTIEPFFREAGFSPGVSQIFAIATVVAPLTVVSIVLGELAPKVFALRNKEWVCLKLSPPMEWFSYAVWPAVWFLETIVSWIMSWGEWGQKSDREGSEEAKLQEIRGAAAVARTSRLIGHREEHIIVSASHMAATPLSKIMLPAPYIGMLSADQSLADALIIAHQEMHTRFPVTEEPGNPQKIFGYVNFKDIVAALRIAPTGPSLRSLVRDLRNFRADMSVSECLEQLIRERIHIALVRDAQDAVIGLITLEDVVEELVGEIYDEFDRLPAHLVQTGKGWIAGGFVSLSKLRETTGIELRYLSEKPIYTLNDWILEHLEQPPRGGDEITAQNCRVLVRKTRHTLVQEAYLERLETAEAPSSSS
jgi:putative hemolysin